MHNHLLLFLKRCLLLSVLFALFLLPCNAQAAEIKGKDKKNENMPITILAEYIHYDNVNGDIFAEGNVRIIRSDQTLTADRMDGNVNTGDIWTKTKTKFQEENSQSDFTGDSAEYNYNTKMGNIYNVKGKTGSQYVTFDSVELLPEKMVGQNAMISRCNAQEHAKCQHTTATRVDIWPNDRLIAYNANIYVLGKRIYHQDRYVSNIGADAKKQLPKIGYNNDYGVYLKYTMAYPFGSKVSLGADFLAATEMGGRTKAWLRYDERNYGLQYSYGYFEDTDHEWIKKENNIRADYYYKYLFNTPLKYKFWFERGKWKDRYKQSWHTEAGAYLTHDPLYLGSKSTYVVFGAGYRKVKESFGNIDEDEYRYDAALHKIFSPKFSVSAVYSDVRNNADIFDYDSIDVDKSITYVISVQPDKRNKVSFLQQYDLERNRVYRNRIEYTRNLHCWEIVLSYERERRIDRSYDNKFNWEIHLGI